VTHANSIVFVIGLTAVMCGIARWSLGAAAIVGGAVLMVVAAWPYLRAGRKI